MSQFSLNFPSEVASIINKTEAVCDSSPGELIELTPSEARKIIESTKEMDSMLEVYRTLFNILIRPDGKMMSDIKTWRPQEYEALQKDLGI